MPVRRRPFWPSGVEHAAQPVVHQPVLAVLVGSALDAACTCVLDLVGGPELCVLELVVAFACAELLALLGHRVLAPAVAEAWETAKPRVLLFRTHPLDGDELTL